MTTWILILTLMDTKGYVTQVESVATPFATWEACNAAGAETRTMPVLLAPGPWQRWAWNRIDWVCVPTSEPREPAASLRERCAEREAAKERLREEMRTRTSEKKP